MDYNNVNIEYKNIKIKGMKTDKYPVNTNKLVASMALTPCYIIMTALAVLIFILTSLQLLIGFSFSDIFKSPLSVAFYFVLTPMLLPFAVLLLGMIMYLCNAATMKTRLSTAGITVLKVALSIQVVIEIIIIIISSVLMFKLISDMSEVDLGWLGWIIYFVYLTIMICVTLTYTYIKNRLTAMECMVEMGMVVTDTLPIFPIIMSFIMILLLICGTIFYVVKQSWFLACMMFVEMIFYSMVAIVMIRNNITLANLKRNMLEVINNR